MALMPNERDALWAMRSDFHPNARVIVKDLLPRLHQVLLSDDITRVEHRGNTDGWVWAANDMLEFYQTRATNLNPMVAALDNANLGKMANKLRNIAAIKIEVITLDDEEQHSKASSVDGQFSGDAQAEVVTKPTSDVAHDQTRSRSLTKKKAKHLERKLARQTPDFNSRLWRSNVSPGPSTSGSGVNLTQAHSTAIEPSADHQDPRSSAPSGDGDESQPTSKQTPSAANNLSVAQSKVSRLEERQRLVERPDSDDNESIVPPKRKEDTPERDDDEPNIDEPIINQRQRRECSTKCFKHLFDPDQDKEVEVHPPSPSYESGGETDNSHSDSDNQQQRRTRANVNNKKSINRETSHKRYKCPDCQFETKRKHNLKQHQQRLHPNERPFKCATCDFAAATMWLLKAHEWIHSDERPFACRYPPCQKRFKTANNRCYHENMHKGVCYECKPCNKSFTDPSNYRKHMQSLAHSEPMHSCRCGQRFTTKSNMRAHQKCGACPEKTQ